jgi:flagellar basal body-associated protein FliL
MYSSDDTWNTPTYIGSTSTEVPMNDQLTNTSTASNSTSSDKTIVYIALGTALLIFIIAGTILVVVFSLRKRKRKCQISPDGGGTPMEQHPQQEQMKQASSKDMLIKK